MPAIGTVTCSCATSVGSSLLNRSLVITTGRIELPQTATTVTVGLFLSVPGQAWFDDVRLEVTSPPPWSEQIHGRYRYLTLPGDELSKANKRYNAESYRLVSQFLGVSGPKQVSYYKYPDRAAKTELTGRVGNAYRDGDAIHTIWPVDRHEIVHVLADDWGQPPALLAEGLAVHLSGRWQGEPVRDYARKVANDGRWVPPTKLLSSRGFRLTPDLVSYAIAGAFVQWVLETYGKPTLRNLYGELRHGAPDEDNRRIVEQQLKTAMPKIDAHLLAWLND